jgi:hypothetical protein
MLRSTGKHREWAAARAFALWTDKTSKRVSVFVVRLARWRDRGLEAQKALEMTGEFRA